jgi:hypothetical protein
MYIARRELRPLSAESRIAAQAAGRLQRVAVKGISVVHLLHQNGAAVVRHPQHNPVDDGRAPLRWGARI